MKHLIKDIRLVAFTTTVDGDLGKDEVDAHIQRTRENLNELKDRLNDGWEILHERDMRQDRFAGWVFLIVKYEGGD